MRCHWTHFELVDQLLSKMFIYTHSLSSLLSLVRLLGLSTKCDYFLRTHTRTRRHTLLLFDGLTLDARHTLLIFDGLTPILF